MTRAARADDLAAVRERGELVWGGDLQGGEPYVFEDPREPAHIVGFEVDIAAAIARELGLQRARFFQVQWSNLVPSLERGDFDVALNGLEDTPERRARLRLSRPYFIYHEVLAVRRGAPYRTLDDLRGKRVATLEPDVRVRAPAGRVPLETVLYEGQEEPYFDLQQGARRRRAARSHHRGSLRLSARRDRVPADAGARAPTSSACAGATRRWRAAVDGALSRMIASGELRRILEAWHLWDDAQQGLAAAPPGRRRRRRYETPSLDRHQVVLFLEGAVVTALLSVAAFAIAMPLGMLLAAARVGRGRVLRAASPRRTSSSSAARRCSCSSTSSTSASRPS